MNCLSIKESKSLQSLTLQQTSPGYGHTLTSLYGPFLNGYESGISDKKRPMTPTMLDGRTGRFSFRDKPGFLTQALSRGAYLIANAIRHHTCLGRSATGACGRLLAGFCCIVGCFQRCVCCGCNIRLCGFSGLTG